MQMDAIDIRSSQQDTCKAFKKIKTYVYDPQMVIGSGFSSNVFKGTNEIDNATVAIKVLQLVKIKNEVEKYLLNNEINALRALIHKNILHTVEILMTKNNVYIITEFCENGDLQKMIRSKRKLADLEALLILRDIVEGYRAIESKNIVHRDLKTANIFLTNTGARIADFGFCEFIGQKKPQIVYNVGSPAYMSPQAYKENIYSSKSDIWSIGIILYEMLLGQTPDKNLTYTQMTTNLMNGKIIVGGDEIKTILIQCFKRDIKERIGSLRLLELVNLEINRLEAMGRLYRPLPVKRTEEVVASQFMPIMTNNGSPQVNQMKMAQPNQMKTNTFPALPSRGHIPSHPNIEPGRTRLQQSRRDRSPVAFLGHRSHQQLQSNKLRSTNGKAYPINKFKSHISMLILLYRLLKYVIDSSLTTPQLLKLILFRHRNFLQQEIDNIAKEEQMERNSQGYKQFQYLKSKFDQAYLALQARQAVQSSPKMRQLNELNNTPINELAAYTFYVQIIMQVISECDNFIGRGTDNMHSFYVTITRTAIMWDYLMLEMEFLELYVEGMSTEDIGLASDIDVVMKEHPKGLTQTHLQLLRYKKEQLNKHIMVSKYSPLLQNSDSRVLISPVSNEFY